VTYLPAFYKTNLYNELAKTKKIFVIYISRDSAQRTSDFVELGCKFEYEVLNDEPFEARNKYRSILNLKKALKNKKAKNLLISGWDLAEFWYLAFFAKAKQKSLAIESTMYESRVDGLRGFIKKVFLSAMDKVYVSGKLSEDIVLKLGFSKDVILTYGVGIINKPLVTEYDRMYKKRYLYLGRLSEEKNLKMLIEAFNELPDFSLSIYGNGTQRSELEEMAEGSNISFSEHIDNKELHSIFAEHDFLILPSITEPWGLVVEEALYFGLPVVVSNRCGSSVLIENGVNGLIIDPMDIEGLKNVLKSIDEGGYEYMQAHTGCDMINKKDKIQISAYLT
jgi:glycosyltransferase involved in cell wall biosynthesis